MKDQTQLELGFNGIRNVADPRRESPRVSRARWWFEQMRQVVDRAFDWQAEAQARPEQTWFAEASGQIRD